MEDQIASQYVIPETTVDSSKTGLTRKLVIILGIVFVLLTGIAIGAVSLKRTRSVVITPVESPTVLAELQAKVTYLTGVAWQVKAGRRIELREGDSLTQSDTVLTEAKTRVIIQFDDGSIISLGDETYITLAQLLPHRMVISEEKGSLFARVHKDPQHAFMVTAGSVTIEAFGTSFAVERDETVDVKVFESTVRVTQDNEKMDVTTNQQWQSEVKKILPMTEQEVKKDEFISWNLKTEETEVVEVTPAPKAEQAASIKLSGSASATDILLNWTTTGISGGGIKLVKGSEPNPSYPGNDYQYFETLGTKNYIWNIADGKTWHFRVCHYVDSACKTYSNDVSITAPMGKSSSSDTVTQLKLTVSKDGSTAKVSWDVTGTSKLGFKVVWGDRSGPTYPTRDGDNYHYLSDPGSRSDSIGDLSGKTYYFRACEYLGGSCGKYSNEVSIPF
jgi:hypothetical protein